MNMEDGRELKSLIRRVAERVIRRMLEPDKAEAGAVALIPSYVPDPQPLAAYLRANFFDGVLCAGDGAAAIGQGFETAGADAPEERQRLFERMQGCEQVLLICPPLSMLKNIARGDDRGFFEQAFMRALLWNKETTVVLDFEKPAFRRGAFFGEVGDALKAMEAMGAKAVSLKRSSGKPEGRFSLVTEAVIKDAHKAGRDRVVCAPGAAVTPLARDAAKDLGVLIDE